jgi:hypothetical protein
MAKERTRKIRAAPSGSRLPVYSSPVAIPTTQAMERGKNGISRQYSILLCLAGVYGVRNGEKNIFAPAERFVLK